MVMSLEHDRLPAPTKLTAAIKKRVVRDIERVIRNGDSPVMVAYDGDIELSAPTVYLPPIGSRPAQTFQGSLLDIRELATIRDRLRREI